MGPYTVVCPHVLLIPPESNQHRGGKARPVGQVKRKERMKLRDLAESVNSDKASEIRQVQK